MGLQIKKPGVVVFNVVISVSLSARWMITAIYERGNCTTITRSFDFGLGAIDQYSKKNILEYFCVRAEMSGYISVML